MNASGAVGRPAEAHAGWGVADIPASLTAFGALPTRARATIVVQSAGRRVARALAGLSACWGLALVSVFIPVAHFVLVLTFTVAGVVVAGLRLREDRRLVRVSGSCPRCGVEQDFEAGGRFKDERALDCPRCHHLLRLVAEPASRGRYPSPHTDRGPE